MVGGRQILPVAICLFVCVSGKSTTCCSLGYKAPYHCNALGHSHEVGVSGDELAAHQNTGRSSWTIYSPHNDKDTLAPPARIHWHPSTGSLVYHQEIRRSLVYQEIRQLLITIKAAAFQLQNLSSASKPFTVFINLTNVLKNLLLSMLR